VELDAEAASWRIQIAGAEGPENVVEVGVHEDTECLAAFGREIRSQTGNNFAGSFRRDVARAFLVEIQAEGIGTQAGGEKGVFGSRYAADFDLEHRRRLVRVALSGLVRMLNWQLRLWPWLTDGPVG